MSALAQRFNAITQQLSAQTKVSWSLEDQSLFDTLLTDMEVHCAKMQSCTSLESLIAEARGVNQDIAQRFASFGFEDFDFETHPVGSFTERPSSVNLDITLESFEEYKKLLIAGGIAGLLLLIAKFVEWLIGRTKNTDATPKGNVSRYEALTKHIKGTTKAREDNFKDVSRAARKADRDLDKDPGATGEFPDPEMDTEFRVSDKAPASSAPPMSEDTAESIKNRTLTKWHQHIDQLTVRAIKETLKNPNAQFNFPFLKVIVDNGLYDALADVISEMNSNLEEINKTFEKNVKIIETGDSYTVKELTDFRIKTLRGIVDPVSGTTRATPAVVDRNRDTRQGSGFIKARELIKRHDQVLQAFSQADYLPLDMYSPEFDDRGDNASPSIVVAQMFSAMQTVTDAKIRYVGDILVDPDVVLQRIQTWIEQQKKQHQGNPDLPTMYPVFLKYMTATVTDIIATYSGVMKLLSQHSTEMKRVDLFIRLFVKHYNSYVTDYTKGLYANRGFNDPREYRKELKDIEATLQIQT